MTAHTCHALRCEVVIPPRMFMCATHWAMVPVPSQRRLWALYRPGQEITKDPSMAYLRHAMACVHYVATFENDRSPMSEDQVHQVMSYQRMLQSRRERGAPLPADVESVDLPSWPYGEETGPPYDDPHGDQRRGFSADDIALAVLTVQPGEIKCPRCWLVHRATLACEEVW